MAYKIFTINPGSTSTKIAMFENDQKTFSANVRHDAKILATFGEINEQFDYRKETILMELEKAGQSLDGVSAVVGRGGGTASLIGGVYEVNELMIEDIRSGRFVRHPANLGCQLAESLAKLYGCKSFVVNPPVVDEFQEIARITGMKGVFRKSHIHALNQKEIGLRFAKSKSSKYEDLNLIIAHIGGGVSVTAHKKGQMIDSNDIVGGDGPMAPTRCGALPVADVIKMCFSGDYTERELYDKMTKSGGFTDHLGTSDTLEVLEMIEAGDKYAKIIYDAMIYQIGKSAGSMAAALHGNIDGIILTGGMANDKGIVQALTDMLSFIAPVRAMPGEFEMEGLASGAIRVLEGKEKVKVYDGIPVWDEFTNT